MAKIHEELVVVKLSKLYKDSNSANDILNEEIVASLEAIVQEVVGNDVVVEIIKD